MSPVLERHGNGDGTRTGADATIVILSAGLSPFLKEVVEAAVSQRAQGGVVVIWSGEVAPRHIEHLNVQTVCIKPCEFSHSRTRQLALDKCETPFVAYLSDDATPCDSDWLPKLLDPFVNPSVGAVYGRQIARAGANAAEKAFRLWRYPAHSVPGYDGESIFTPISNANAAYRKSHLAKAGGFGNALYAEDRAAASALLDHGYSIAYEPRATVWHSHTTTLRGAARRARLLAHARTPRRRTLPAVPISHRLLHGFQLVRISAHEGVAAVISTGAHAGARALGYLAGRLQAAAGGRR